MRTTLLILSCLIFCGCADVEKPAVAQISNAAVTKQFRIWGNCNMCKETIESSLQDESIVEANWNKDSKQMQIQFDSTKISLPEIYHRIAMVGYDTEAERGNDSAYAELPDCCQYDRKP